ncbi:MAG: helix-turn-helix domain-containing protein [Flavisolibacter sp.]|jgi:chromosomal replication initiation ATPase DnaA
MRPNTIDQQLLPAINDIIIDAENKLSKLVGTPVIMKMHLKNTELNEALLQELVCSAFNVTWRDITGNSRQQDIADARHVYWWLSIKMLGKRPSTLARECGKKDHTTVLHGRDRIEDLMDHGRDNLCKTIKNIEGEILNAVQHTTT